MCEAIRRDIVALFSPRTGPVVGLGEYYVCEQVAKKRDICFATVFDVFKVMVGQRELKNVGGGLYQLRLEES